MLTRRYVVHSCAETQVAIQADYQGRPIEATVPGLIVEFVAKDGGRTQTEAFIPDDLAAARGEFSVGAAFTVTYEKELG